MKPAWLNHHCRKGGVKRNSRTRRKLEDMPFRDLVKVLDREYSTWLRMSAADDQGIVRCVTCGTLHHWKEITVGHYVSRARISVRWDIRNTAPQCVKCNSYNGGEQFLMRKHLVAIHGEKAIKAMEQWALITKTENRESLIEKIADYRERNRAAKKKGRYDR
jgi:hypothetical protein